MEISPAYLDSCKLDNSTRLTGHTMTIHGWSRTQVVAAPLLPFLLRLAFWTSSPVQDWLASGGYQIRITTFNGEPYNSSWRLRPFPATSFKRLPTNAQILNRKL